MKKLDLTFYKNVKPLEIGEYKTWRRLFSKVLKIGTELEFNMKKNSGSCKGYNRDCVCPDFVEGTCGKRCVFLKDNKCDLGIKGLFNCANVLPTCDNVKCVTCDNFKLLCDGTTCINFIPECLLCSSLLPRCFECEHKFKADKTPQSVRRGAEFKLLATQNFGQVGKHGILQVVADGSLENGGLEIITVGRRFDFDTFNNMFSHILKTSKECGGYVDERCSFHVHILNEYYTKINNKQGTSRHPDSDTTLNINSFEKTMPSIILTNIVQLWRKYETSMYWLSCTLPYSDSITRWEKFRVSLIPYSPILTTFSGIMEAIGALVGKSRYGSLNLSNTRTDGSRLHLEFRVCDMAISPSYMTAMCALFHAIILKAVDISCYGLLNVEDTVWCEKETSIKENFVNGARSSYDSCRTSNLKLTDGNKKYLTTKTHELISLVSPILSDSDPAEKILRKLADKPIAYRLIDAMTSGKIASGNTIDAMNTFDLEAELSEDTKKIGNTEENILKILAIGKIQGCDTEGAWIKEVAVDGNISITTVTNYINSLVTAGDAYWNKTVGSYLYH